MGLQEICLSFKPGAATVVVGLPGSCKITLIRALVGLLSLRGATVTFDSFFELGGLEELRRNATVVFQQTVLGEGGFKENLRAVAPNSSNAEIQRIADISKLTPII